MIYNTEECIVDDSPKDCLKCHDKYAMPYDFCCLVECGNYECCKFCENGIYKEE